MPVRRLFDHRIFIVIAIFNAFLAVGVWFARDINWFSTPVLQVHQKLIGSGFLWSVLLAVFHWWAPAKKKNVGLLWHLLLLLGLAGIAFTAEIKLFYFLHAVLIVSVLGSFLLTTFYKASVASDESRETMLRILPHILGSSFLALLGSYNHYIGNSYRGFFLYQVGSFLLLLMAFGAEFKFQKKMSEGSRYTWGRNLLFDFSALMMTVSMTLVAYGHRWANLALFVLLVFYILYFWKVPTWELKGFFHLVTIWLSVGCIMICFVLTWYDPGRYVTWFHLLFIGSFSVFSFLIMSRLSVAEEFATVKKKMLIKPFSWLSGFLILTLINRLAYGLTNHAMWKKAWMHNAGFFWWILCFVWFFTFVPQILSKQQSDVGNSKRENTKDLV